MMGIDDRWLFAIVAVIAGLVAGAAAGWLARRWLTRPDRRPAFKAIAVATSAFLFWLGTGTGILFAIGANSPDTLRPIPARMIDWIPNVLVAGLLVLGGTAAAIAVASIVGRALERSTGEAHSGAERTVRWIIVLGVSVLALGQLGVRTDILLVVVSGIIGSVALTLALLAGLGGKEVANQLAIGRTLQPELVPGARITTESVTGVIVELRATTVVLVTDEDKRILISYAHLLESPFGVDPPRT